MFLFISSGYQKAQTKYDAQQLDSSYDGHTYVLRVPGTNLLSLFIVLLFCYRFEEKLDSLKSSVQITM